MLNVLKAGLVHHPLDLGTDIHYSTKPLGRVAEFRLPLDNVSCLAEMAEY